MTPLNRRMLMGLLGSAALTGCVTPSVPVTRTAPDPFEGGIGGTGIVGVLTDFSSLLINGLRVEVTGATRVATPFGPVSDSALAPGQALTVVASRTADRLVARTVRIDHSLVGLVRPAGAGVSVNGVPLLIEGGALGRATIGARVAVSGVWTQGGLSVSRIDPADAVRDPLTAAAPDLIAGVYSPGGATGATIGGQAVRLQGVPPPAGSYLVARGRFNVGVLEVSLTRGGRFDARARLSQLSVDGFLEPVASRPGFRVAGLGHSFARDLDLSPLGRRRALYFGRYDGRFAASAGYVVPSGFDDRRRLLRNGFEGGHEGRVIRITD